MSNKSPFFIIEEFVSPLQCEDIVFRLDNRFPQYDGDDNVKCTQKLNTLTENRIMPVFLDVIPMLESYFDFEYAGTTKFNFNWYPAGYNNQEIICENSVNTNTGWKRVNEYDFTCFIFLNDHQEKIPFDPMYEVSGGKHEYPTHGFGFNPKRGTLIVHPSAPNFSYAISPILEGELNVVRFNLAAEELYNYKMENFKGDYNTWF